MADLVSKKSSNVVSNNSNKKNSDVCSVQSNNGVIELDNITASNNQLITLCDDPLDEDDLVTTNNTRNELSTETKESDRENEEKSLQEIIEKELDLRISSSNDPEELITIDDDEASGSQPEVTKKIILKPRQDSIDVNAAFIGAEMEYIRTIEDPHTYRNGRTRPIPDDSNSPEISPIGCKNLTGNHEEPAINGFSNSSNLTGSVKNEPSHDDSLATEISAIPPTQPRWEDVLGPDFNQDLKNSDQVPRRPDENSHRNHEDRIAEQSAYDLIYAENFHQRPCTDAAFPDHDDQCLHDEDSNGQPFRYYSGEKPHGEDFYGENRHTAFPQRPCQGHVADLLAKEAALCENLPPLTDGGFQQPDEQHPNSMENEGTYKSEDLQQSSPEMSESLPECREHEEPEVDQHLDIETVTNQQHEINTLDLPRIKEPQENLQVLPLQPEVINSDEIASNNCFIKEECKAFHTENDENCGFNDDNGKAEEFLVSEENLPHRENDVRVFTDTVELYSVIDQPIRNEQCEERESSWMTVEEATNDRNKLDETMNERNAREGANEISNDGHVTWDNDSRQGVQTVTATTNGLEPLANEPEINFVPTANADDDSSNNPTKIESSNVEDETATTRLMLSNDATVAPLATPDDESSEFSNVCDVSVCLLLFFFN